MPFQQFPALTPFEKGEAWQQEYDLFRAKVYVPHAHPCADIVNAGFRAPYLVVMEEREMPLEEAVRYAEDNGFADVARRYASSVVFVYPTAQGGWAQADASLYRELIAESRINQYYKSGVCSPVNRFTKETEGHFIRGAIFRVRLYGCGDSADYIARCCLSPLEGQYLWGPGDISPSMVSLERLTSLPASARRDMPVVSIGNTPEIEQALQCITDCFTRRDALSPMEDDTSAPGRYRRWCGVLEEEPTMEEEGLFFEADHLEVQTSPDNRGDDAALPKHPVGYIAFCRKELMNASSLPTLLLFHGGGDSALYISHVSGWYRVAKRHGFLLIAIENHLNTTAAEVQELILLLKNRYPIDPRRIYASGFSMGGCKCWDLLQEYPETFAALAPMDATFEVGLNIYGEPAPKPINQSVSVPVYYAGGEITPLPELPFQAHKCWDRIRWLFALNKVRKPYAPSFEDKESWSEPIWGVSGDIVDKQWDATRRSTLTVHRFISEDGVCRTALASISGQGHECREHTCEDAWRFMSGFMLDTKQEENHGTL